MGGSLSVLEQPLSLTLPFTNTQHCYTNLKKYPELDTIFHDELKAIAESNNPLPERLRQLEERRQRALEEYLESGKSQKLVDSTFNCCTADLYYALFMTIAQKVQASELHMEEKLAALDVLLKQIETVLAWNETKRNEISIQLYGIYGEIELGDEEEQT